MAQSVRGRDLGLSFFEDEKFEVLQVGVYDSESSKVYLNEQKDFAVIHPIPVMDYSSYVPRSVKLGLKDPKKTERYLTERLQKVRKILGPEFSSQSLKVLEIGASDGDCLLRMREEFPRFQLTGFEPSAPHRGQAIERGLTMVGNLEELGSSRFELIVGFHTFEHFTDPKSEISRLGELLNPSGSFVIEIPSLSDPLLQFYQLPEFSKFYFQCQHPFVYSESSVVRLLESLGRKVKAVEHFQRYGLPNHLNWLKDRKPGIDSAVQEMMGQVDVPYRRIFEERRAADTLFLKFY